MFDQQKLYKKAIPTKHSIKKILILITSKFIAQPYMFLYKRKNVPSCHRTGN